MPRQLVWTLLPALLLGVTGCGVLGAQSIRAGRAAYNTVLNQTEDEQLLTILVRERYDETYSLLAVASITASLRVESSIGGQVGLGPRSGFAENLVPLEAGIVYEESPTISYVPISGEVFASQMLEPLTLEEAILLNRAGTRSAEPLVLVVRRVNGIANPLFHGPQPDDSFARSASLLRQFREHGAIDVDPVGDGSFRLVVADAREEFADGLSELRVLLGLSGEITVGRRIPLEPGAGAPNHQVLDIDTPSVLEVLRACAQGVRVPKEHSEAGWVRALDPAYSHNSMPIKVQSSRSRPDDAVVAVRHRGSWFWISSTDTKSKQSFSLLRTLIGSRLDRAGGRSQPVLTLPVGP